MEQSDRRYHVSGYLPTAEGVPIEEANRLASGLIVEPQIVETEKSQLAWAEEELKLDLSGVRSS